MVLFVGAGRIWQLLVEGLPVADASAEKYRPFRYAGERIRSLREETPESGMMPAELVLRAVAVGPNPLAKPPHLRGELFTRHAVEIFVHASPLVVVPLGFPALRARRTGEGQRLPGFATQAMEATSSRLR